MKNGKIIFWIKVFIITASAALAASPFSCKIERSNLKILNANKESPQLKEVKMAEANEAVLYFSKEVELENTALTINGEKSDVKTEIHSEKKRDEEYESRLVFSEKLSPALSYELFAIAKDKDGNTLSFSVPLKGINANLPAMRITEVHNRKGVGKHKGVAYPKEEFVELVALSDGNLTGVELFSASKNKVIFEFQDINVRKNDLITVHLTNSEEKGWQNETGDDIKLSKTKWYSSDNARDLWNEKNLTCLSKTQDVILLRYKEREEILDAFLYSLPDTKWETEEIASAAAKAFEDKRWEGSSPEDAVDSTGISPSKSFVRVKSENNKESWKITKSRGETPGKY